jgi:hypothetical protein
VFSSLLPKEQKENYDLFSGAQSIALQNAPLKLGADRRRDRATLHSGVELGDVVGNLGEDPAST